jgi:F0F1-type ATP synthase assembly protein I
MSHAGRIVVVQALLGVVCSAAFFALDMHIGKSALLAVVSSWIPSGYYAWVQARTFDATRLLVHAVLKTLLTLVLMAVCVVKVDISPIGFFVTFAVMQLSYFVGDRKTVQESSD